MIDQKKLLIEIKKFLSRHSSSQKSVAKILGISPSYLSDVLNGRREISGHLANKFGYSKKIFFVKELNDEAKRERIPTRPEQLMGANSNNIKTPALKGRAAKSMKVRQ